MVVACLAVLVLLADKSEQKDDELKFHDEATGENPADKKQESTDDTRLTPSEGDMDRRNKYGWGRFFGLLDPESRIPDMTDYFRRQRRRMEEQIQEMEKEAIEGRTFTRFERNGKGYIKECTIRRVGDNSESVEPEEHGSFGFASG